ncbi:MAG TPA: carbamoyltransferase C-terminal domain-containing protein [Allosphingosinicella sp.]|jgi:carbamoyltransferase
MSVYYIGFSVTGHDPAFAIVDGEGRLLFAEATERYVQDKRAWGIPPDHFDHLAGALRRHCADATRLVAAATWAKPRPASDAPGDGGAERSFGIVDRIQAHWMREQQRRAFEFYGLNLPLIAPGVPIERRAYDHHLCHAAYAAASSPYEDAQCLIVDGEGEVGSVSLFAMCGRRLERRWRSFGPGSLGFFYGFVTQACGFDWRLGEEWKTMGLAAFGTPQPDAVALLERLVGLERGRPRAAPIETWDEVAAALAPWRREPGEDVLRGADLSASGQAAYAALADGILEAAELVPEGNLVLGGGCALNSSYNGAIRRRFGLGGVHIPSAPADDGNAAGAALLAWQEDRGGPPLPRGWDNPYLGTAPDLKALERIVARGGFRRVTEIADGDTGTIAERLAGGAILGVMRGRAEFGPRALGNRSILADPRSPEMKDRLNRDVKGREPYRPFAPVVLEDQAEHWFECADPSPYMSFTRRWRAEKRAQVPAVVHADGTGRLQTVNAEAAPWLASLTAELGAVTGVPIVLNTSLNVMGKPIAHSVEDAVTILATTGLDALLIENVLIEKAAA